MGEGNGNPLQYSCLESTVDKGAWWAAVHGVAQSWTRLKQLSMHALEKGMATHSSVLAWRIPGTEKPGGLPSMGSHRVKHDWSDLAAAAAIHVAIMSHIIWHMRLSIFKYKVMLLTKVNHKVIVQIYIPANNIYQSSYCLYSSIMKLFH